MSLRVCSFTIRFSGTSVVLPAIKSSSADNSVAVTADPAKFFLSQAKVPVISVCSL
jgi:hypothetical protein